jgi:16S rRNA (uracil1498-N3)-methyltransferase
MARVVWCADADAVAHLIVDHLDPRLVVDGTDGHHLQRVRRLRVGEPVTAADGTGRWCRYRITHTEPGVLSLEASGEPAEEPALAPPLRVACALTKGERPDAVVRHCSELGVDAVLPVVAARSVVRWDTDRSAAAIARLRRVAREAAGQSRRARLLTVEPAVALAALAGEPGLVVADRAGQPAHLVPEPPPAGWLVVVGPEGGLTADEYATLGHPPRLAVGPHVLRAETAALAAAAALAGRRRPVPTPDHPA